MPAPMIPHKADCLAVLLSGTARVARVLTHFRKSDNRTDAEIMGLLGLRASNVSTLKQIGYGSPQTGLGNDNLLRLAEVLGLGGFKPEFDMLLSGPESYRSQREKNEMADPDFVARVD